MDALGRGDGQGTGMVDENLVPAFHLPREKDVVWRSLLGMMRRPEHSWPRELHERPSISGYVHSRKVTLLSDPDAVRFVLTTSKETFTVPDFYQKVVASVTGRSNAVILDEHNHLHRAIHSFFLNKNHLDEIVAQSIDQVKGMGDRWEEGATPDGLLLTDVLSQASFHAFWRFFFRVPSSKTLGEGLSVEIDKAARLLRTDSNKLAAQALAHVARVGVAMMEEQEGLENILGLSLSNRDRDVLPSILHDNAKLLLAGGLDTAPTLVSWALWFLALDGELQDRVYNEIYAADGERGGLASSLNCLVLLQQVLNECLRLLPPVAATTREAKHPLRLAGEEIPEKGVVIVPLYLLHRHKGLWADADRFQPDRFGPGTAASRPKNAFFPFSIGPFSCAGPRIGWLQAMTLVSAILLKFRVECVAPPSRPNLVIGLTLRADPPLRLRLIRRR